MNHNVLIIAEAGVNHNGSLAIAKQLIDVAVSAGVDFVKFQTFSADSIVSRDAPKAMYQQVNDGVGESQYQMLKRLELTSGDHESLVAYCKKMGVGFLSTAFDLNSIAYLKGLDVPLMKVPSGEITNLPYLRAINACRKPVLLSTGMATEYEVSAALEVIRDCPVTILHCTTEYPCPFDAVNLKAMITLRDRFGLPVGYSDHTRGIEVPIAAVAMGAKVIEKHFTLDRSMPGPDHMASLEPEELKEMVKAIRNIESALGDGIKKPAMVEMKNIAIARKSIVALTPIRKGELLTEDNLTVKRPGGGISPMQWDEVVGTRASRDYKVDEQI